MDWSGWLSIIAIAVSTGTAIALAILGAKLEKTTHVHKSVVDLELETYRRLWEKLYPVHFAATKLRPMVDVSGATKEEKLRTLEPDFYALQQLAHEVRPFLPKQIWEKVMDLVQIVHTESVEYEQGDPARDGQEYWYKARENQKRIGDLVSEIAEAVQARLASLGGPPLSP